MESTTFFIDISEECGICMEKNQKLMALYCGHHICGECNEKCSSDEIFQCPYCRDRRLFGIKQPNEPTTSVCYMCGRQTYTHTEDKKLQDYAINRRCVLCGRCFTNAAYHDAKCPKYNKKLSPELYSYGKGLPETEEKSNSSWKKKAKCGYEYEIIEGGNKKKPQRKRYRKY